MVLASFQATTFAESAQTANNMWQLANFRDHTFDLLCCQFYIIQAVHRSLYGLNPHFISFWNTSVKCVFLPLEAPFSKQWNRPKISNSSTILVYFYVYKEFVVDVTGKNELISMICLFRKLICGFFLVELCVSAVIVFSWHSFFSQHCDISFIYKNSSCDPTV